MTRKILVTSALPYANGAIHLGHLVEYIQTDIWTRFQKMRGHECWYVCADDTHGTPIMLRAEKEGITPEQLIARVHAEHFARFRRLPRRLRQLPHHAFRRDAHYSEDIYGKLKAAGLIEVRSIEQFYDPVKAMFLPDRFIKGECPKCGAKDQYGDACESCGAAYAPTELKNPYSAVSGAKPVLKLLRPLLLQALRPALPGVPAPRHARRLQPARGDQQAAGMAGRARREQAHRLGHLARRALLRLRDSRAPGKFFYVWLDAPIGYMGSFKNLCARKRASTSTSSGARVRRPSSTTSSARTSSTSTPCSGRPNWNTPATARRPASSPTAS
jgi:methionyl-tRNA synthetase